MFHSNNPMEIYENTSLKWNESVANDSLLRDNLTTLFENSAFRDKVHSLAIWNQSYGFFKDDAEWINFDFVFFGFITTVVAIAGFIGNTIFIAVQ